ncbi:MAG: hypothetical protein WC319_00585 [Candidatus Paceibacterota bacterium]|jgi:ABC-type antimicrobial peptide transport system permease subunit
MQYISLELINLVRAILFGVAVGYAFFYVLLYFKAMIENMAGVKKFDVDLWWIMMITVSVVAGILGAIFLM